MDSYSLSSVWNKYAQHPDHICCNDFIHVNIESFKGKQVNNPLKCTVSSLLHRNTSKLITGVRFSLSLNEKLHFLKLYPIRPTTRVSTWTEPGLITTEPNPEVTWISLWRNSTRRPLKNRLSAHLTLAASHIVLSRQLQLSNLTSTTTPKPNSLKLLAVRSHRSSSTHSHFLLHHSGGAGMMSTTPASKSPVIL